MFAPRQLINNSPRCLQRPRQAQRPPSCSGLTAPGPSLSPLPAPSPFQPQAPSSNNPHPRPQPAFSYRQSGEPSASAAVASAASAPYVCSKDTTCPHHLDDCTHLDLGGVLALRLHGVSHRRRPCPLLQPRRRRPPHTDRSAAERLCPVPGTMDCMFLSPLLGSHHILLARKCVFRRSHHALRHDQLCSLTQMHADMLAGVSWQGCASTASACLQLLYVRPATQILCSCM